MSGPRPDEAVVEPGSRGDVAEGLLRETSVPGRFGPVVLRLRRIAGRWLATAVGPTGGTEVGADASPYLAAQLALERWQLDATEVLRAVGRIERWGWEDAGRRADGPATPAAEAVDITGR